MHNAAHKKCGVSTGIHDGLTFGHGELDDNGYWEFPCYECAREWERLHPEDFPCWPFDEKTLADLKSALEKPNKRS
jgi:hypothetical protein